MQADAELVQFRSDYYGVLARVLAAPPDETVSRALAQGCAERAAAADQVHPLLGAGWRDIAAGLRDQTPEDLADEFGRLFVDPYGTTIYPYESHYLTGRMFREPLVAVRSFMHRAGVEKSIADFPEPEDALIFELEIMRWLIDRQQQSLGQDDESRWIELQCQFLAEHLLIWGATCAEDMAGAGSSPFYRGVALVLRGFLETEQQLLREQGLPDIESLEHARRRLSTGAWKGPLFDPENDMPQGGPAPDKE